MRLNIHLTFNGQCDEAFRLYERCLGGEITTRLTYGEAAMPDTAPYMSGKILHATLTLADQRLTGVDVAAGQYRQPQDFTVQLNLEEREAAERIVATLAEAGTVHLPFQQTFWATRYGLVTDRFGTPWEINCGSGAG